jgi:hypothetical protein
MSSAIDTYCVHGMGDESDQRLVLIYSGPAYSDEKIANRDIRVWHLVIENGYCMMDKSKTPRHKVR